MAEKEAELTETVLLGCTEGGVADQGCTEGSEAELVCTEEVDAGRGAEDWLPGVCKWFHPTKGWGFINIGQHKF